MSRTRKKNRWDAFDDLREQHANGKPQPKSIPQRLPVSKIKRHPEVFQHRRPAQHVSEAHIRELAGAAKVRDLDPLTVWWDGKHWSLIDGHHRIQAYLLAGKGTNDVPVEVFEGTPEDALGRAAKANTKAKLMMSGSEKSNAAWHMVVMTPEMSKSKQAENSGVSERLVASMRKTKATLSNQGRAPSQLADMTWEQARRAVKGEDSDDWSPEEEEKRVEQMALALRKALGATAERQPEIFWQAVETYSPQLARSLVGYIAERFEDDAEDATEDEK